MAISAPIISNLFFVDDSFVFFQALPNECEMIEECLSKYKEASRQVVNYDKSSILFSRIVDEDIHNFICYFLGVKICVNHGKYLGLPSMISKVC